MSSAPITDIKSLFLGGVNAGGKSKGTVSEDSFSQVFDKTQGSDNTPEPAAKTARSEDSESISNHANIQKKDKPELTDKTPKAPGDVDEAQMEAAMEEAASQMVEQTAKVLEVTVEDVEAVLDTLGLTPLDLFNTEGLTQVIQALNPEADALSIMTNEQLFADLKGLMNFGEELMNQMEQQFELPKEEVAAFMENLKGQMQQAGVAAEVNPQSELEIPVETAEEPPTQMAADHQPEMAEITVEAIVEEVPVEEVSETLDQMEVSMTKTTEETANPAETVTPVKTEATGQTAGEKGAKNREEGSTDAGTGQNFAQTVMNRLTEAVNQTSSITTTYGANGTEIIHQITEYIKVHVNVDTTEMELQLHPASLGNVKVQIASTEGVLTATFTTQNEAVKAALESQMVQLKESFEQQGLKVESVEVNVSAQGFERSLDEQEQRQQREAFEAEERRRRGRRIRLDGIGGMEGIPEEEIAEEDKVIADMMIRNGNTVDYTV